MLLRAVLRMVVGAADGIRGMWRAWSDFWFAPSDPTLPALLRICAGGVLVLVLVQSTALIPVLYAADGMLDFDTVNALRRDTPTMVDPDLWSPEPGDPPRPPIARHPELINAPGNAAYREAWNIDPPQLYGRGMPLFSHLFHVRDLTTIYLLHAVALLVALAFTVGFGSRVTTVSAWFVALCYLHRSGVASFGMDTMLAVVLLYLMIAPATAALSVDRLLAARRSPTPLPPPEATASATVALRCIQVHFCVIYLASGLSKLQGPAWWSGDAIWQTLSNFEFIPARLPWSEPLLRWICEHQVVREVFLYGGCVFTLTLEVTLPFWIWYRRSRPVLMVGSALLHTGIGVLMGLTTFGMLMLVMLAAFLPAEVVRAMLGRVRSAWGRLSAKREAVAEREMVGVG